MNRNAYLCEEDFERRAEMAEASSKLSAAEAYKAHVWRKRFAIFLCLLALPPSLLAGKL